MISGSSPVGSFHQILEYLVRAQYRPIESLGVPVERFFSIITLRAMGKAGLIGIEIDAID